MTDLLPAAVLWDMDGTLIDSEPYWMSSETELVESFGGVWRHEDAVTLVGAGLLHSAAVLRGRGVDLSDQEIIQRLTDRVLEQIEAAVPWRPGARKLLAELGEAGIPTALVTMSIRRMADSINAALPAGSFTRIVAGDEVTHAKPHPAAYLRAAELLGVEASRCIAIEDSTTGLASAVASGAVCIGVPLHVPLEDSLGYTIWPTLEGRTVDDLGRLYAASQESAA
ncbi:MAG TPA: HAD family hydrolase [Lacisediminihabitans sp.]|uniref:HAD family hydrolase n=1 Tax=Lacisediminihabitans sp. TaxID=2787631 RepID=UPI002ED8D99C